MALRLFGMKIQPRKELLVVIIIVIVFLGGLAGYLIIKGNKDIIIESKSVYNGGVAVTTAETSLLTDNINESGMPTEAKAASNDAGNEKKEEIKIYVTGCVKKPGIVALKKGQLIDDALRLAGGVTKDADLNSINLVYMLEENTMLYIKSTRETKEVARDSSGGDDAGKGVKLVKDSGGAVVNEKQNTVNSNGKININTALLDELDTLPGIGEATAQDIISYREKNGSFNSIQDIMKVPRIKESRFEKIKDLISVD